MLLAVLAPLTVAANRERAAEDEYRLKAALIYKVFKYIEWPKERQPPASSSWVVGVYGEDPFGGALEAAFRGKNHEGHTFTVLRTGDLGALHHCHMLFLPRGEMRNLPRVARALRGSGVFLVGEAQDFAVSGGILNITRSDNRLGLEINVEAAKRERLGISSSLLKLARIVKDPREI